MITRRRQKEERGWGGGEENREEKSGKKSQIKKVPVHLFPLHIHHFLEQSEIRYL